MRRLLACALSLTLASPAQAAPVWTALEAWMREGLGIQSQAPRTEALRAHAAQILRHEPSLALEPAIARAFVQTYPAQPGAEGALSDLLTHGFLQTAGGVGAVYDAALFDGRLVVAGSNGVHEEQVDGWRRVVEPIAFHVADLGGRLLAATGDGLFARENGHWTRQPLPAGNLVHSVARIDGVDYAATDHGLVEHASSSQAQVDPGLEGLVSKVIKFAGRLYACTERGLFERGKEWKRVFPRQEASPAGPPTSLVLDAASIGGRLHVGSVLGLFARNDAGDFELAPGTPTGAVYSFASAGGAHYASKADRLLVFENGLWSTVTAVLPPGTHRVIEIEGRLFLAGADGLYRWYRDQNGLPSDWRERALADLGADIGRVAKASPEAPADPLRRQDGRSLFNGLATRIGPSLGKLGFRP